MPNELQVRELARAAIRANKLPRQDPDRTWGGNGMGMPCTICGQPITRDEVEYELQFRHDGPEPRLDRFHLHLRCFAAWEMERTKRGGLGP
jgi:hypothetical protein